MKNFKTLCKNGMPVFLLAAALLFLLVIYGPCEQYFTNVYDFSFDIYDLLVMFIPLFLALLSLSFAVLALADKIGRRLTVAASACLMTAFAAFYVQGTFFSSNLPILDGHVIDWSEYSYMRRESAAIWLISAAVCGALVFVLKNERFLKLGSYIGGFGLSFLLLSSVLSGISGDGFIKKDDVLVTAKHIGELSDEQNFVIILLDAVDADAFNAVMNDSPQYESVFSGFTFFKNTVGSYQYTAYAVPMILSGEKYLCDGNYYQYLKHVYSSSELFGLLKEKGFSLNLYNEDVPSVYDWISSFNNIESNNQLANFVYPVNYIKTMFKLSGLKYFPYDLKKKCNVSPTSIMGDSAKKASGDVWNSQLKPFYDLVNDSVFTTGNNKNFSFIYLDGAHVPFETTSDLDFSPSATYQDEVKASVLVAGHYVEKLKSCGAYDNTVIVVLADHGFAWREGAGRQNPLLMVKGINEQDAFTVSDVPVSHEDLQQGFENLINGSTAQNAFASSANKDERLYYESDGAIGVHSFTEYIQYGYANDLTTLRPSGKVYSFE